jgi:hypothetical protein
MEIHYHLFHLLSIICPFFLLPAQPDFIGITQNEKPRALRAGFSRPTTQQENTINHPPRPAKI